jgi:hypothetical protein
VVVIPLLLKLRFRQPEWPRQLNETRTGCACEEWRTGDGFIGAGIADAVLVRTSIILAATRNNGSSGSYKEQYHGQPFHFRKGRIQ